MRRGRRRRRRRIRGGKNVIITRAKNKLRRRLVGLMWATRTLKRFIHFSGGFVRCMTLDGGWFGWKREERGQR